MIWQAEPWFRATVRRVARRFRRDEGQVETIAIALALFIVLLFLAGRRVALQ